MKNDDWEGFICHTVYSWNFAYIGDIAWKIINCHAVGKSDSCLSAGHDRPGYDQNLVLQVLATPNDPDRRLLPVTVQESVTLSPSLTGVTSLVAAVVDNVRRHLDLGRIPVGSSLSPCWYNVFPWLTAAHRINNKRIKSISTDTCNILDRIPSLVGCAGSKCATCREWNGHARSVRHDPLRVSGYWLAIAEESYSVMITFTVKAASSCWLWCNHIMHSKIVKRTIWYRNHMLTLKM